MLKSINPEYQVPWGGALFRLYFLWGVVMTSKKVPGRYLIKLESNHERWGLQAAFCSRPSSIIWWNDDIPISDRWSTWHRFLFYFFWGGGVEASNKCVCGVCDRDGVWGCGHCEGNSIIRKCVFLSFFNSELKATTMTSRLWVQPNPRTALDQWWFWQQQNFCGGNCDLGAS